MQTQWRSTKRCEVRGSSCPRSPLIRSVFSLAGCPDIVSASGDPFQLSFHEPLPLPGLGQGSQRDLNLVRRGGLYRIQFFIVVSDVERISGSALIAYEDNVGAVELANTCSDSFLSSLNLDLGLPRNHNRFVPLRLRVRSQRLFLTQAPFRRSEKLSCVTAGGLATWPHNQPAKTQVEPHSTADSLLRSLGMTDGMSFLSQFSQVLNVR